MVSAETPPTGGEDDGNGDADGVGTGAADAIGDAEACGVAEGVGVGTGVGVAIGAVTVTDVPCWDANTLASSPTAATAVLTVKFI